MKVTQQPPSPAHEVSQTKTGSVSTKPELRPELRPEFRNEETNAEASSAAFGKGAKIEISDNARLMRTAVEIAKKAPDVRSEMAEKMAAIKKSLASGTYQVDAAKISDRLVDEHLNQDFGKNNL